MKIDEINPIRLEQLNEELSGTATPVKTGFWSKAKSKLMPSLSDKQKKLIAKRARKFVPKWHQTVQNYQSAGIEMSGESPEGQKNYIDALKKFASSGMPKLFDSPRGKQLSRELATKIKRNSFSDKELTNFLTQTIALAQVLQTDPQLGQSDGGKGAQAKVRPQGGGKVAGQTSQTPGAIAKRNKRAQAKASQVPVRPQGGGKVAGQLSQTPGAIAKRNKRAQAGAQLQLMSKYSKKLPVQ